MVDTTLFVDEPQTIQLLHSMKTLISWLNSVPKETRLRFLSALAYEDSESQAVLMKMVGVVEDPNTTDADRRNALATIAETLSSKHCGDACALGSAEPAANTDSVIACHGWETPSDGSQEATFADRLRDLMVVKGVTQQDLSKRLGCSQPAISQLLNRKCRPQKKTILGLAEALRVQPQELWPDLDIVEMLDAVASFQQDDYVMTEAEAKALRGGAGRNVAKIPSRPLPTRGR